MNGDSTNFSITFEGVTTITFFAADNAGNVEAPQNLLIKIDKSAPNLTAAASTGGNPYNSGTWTNLDVQVVFNCTDSLSGVASVSAPVTVVSEGLNAPVIGTCSDAAGNSAETTFGDINIDRTAPNISIASPIDGSIYQLNGPVTANYSCSDGGSGIGSCVGTSANSSLIDTESEGTKTFIVTSTDNVGNSRQLTISYSVVNTATGSNVPVEPVDTTTGLPSPIDLNFSSVTGGGTTTVSSSTHGPPPPNGFKIGTPPTYYDISTTATFSGMVSVCINYSGASYHNENNLKLWHFNSATNQWENITTSLDTVNNVICGEATSLSPFVPLEQDMAPEFTAPNEITVDASSSSGATVIYNLPTATDDFDSFVPVQCSPASGTTFGLGTTNVSCTATDSVGNTTTRQFAVNVTFAWSDVLQPINLEGTSVFKLGSTVPVKFRFTGHSAAVTDAIARLYNSKISNGVAGTELEAASTSAATTGNQFRYDATTGQYIFNWGTKGLTAGTYQLRIDLGDGVLRTVIVSLQK